MPNPKQGRLDYGTYQPMKFNKSCQNNFFLEKRKKDPGSSRPQSEYFKNFNNKVIQ